MKSLRPTHLEIFETGEVEQFLADIGTKVPVGTPLAKIRTEQEVNAGIDIKPSQEALVIEPPATMSIAPHPTWPPISAVSPPPTIGRMRASPAARRLARSCKVNLAAVAGSGPGGAIIFKDIERQLTAATITVEKKFPEGLDLDAMRVTIAAAMAPSPAPASAACTRSSARCLPQAKARLGMMPCARRQRSERNRAASRRSASVMRFP